MNGDTTWLMIGVVALLALIVTVGALAFIAHRLRTRAASAPHILIGNRKVPLRGALRLGRATWQSLARKSLDDVEEDHAELFQAQDGAWEVRLRNGEYMFVDGRRSRHNRLRPGAFVSLGRSGRAAFQFYS